MNYHDMSNAQNINYRKSGFMLAGITAAVYAFLFIRGKHQPYLAVVAAILGISALFEAWPLRKAIELLIKLGNGMHRFTNPLACGLIYCISVIPTALVLKLSGKKVLQLRYDSKIASYWENHTHGKAWKESFRNQF